MTEIGGSGDTCALHRAEDMAARFYGLEETQDEICGALDHLRNDPTGLDARIEAP